MDTKGRLGPYQESFDFSEEGAVGGNRKRGAQKDGRRGQSGKDRERRDQEAPAQEIIPATPHLTVVPPTTATIVPLQAKELPQNLAEPIDYSERIRNRMLASAYISPLEVLMTTMVDRWKEAEMAGEPDVKLRLQEQACAVAVKVAPYLHPRLSAVATESTSNTTVNVGVNLLSADALKAAIRGG